MPRRYRKLRGDTAYYPFAARTGLRARQRRHARLLRVLGTAALALAAVLLVRQTVFRGGQPNAPAPIAAAQTTAPGQAHVTVAPVAATRDALADTREADAAAHTTPESAAAPTVESSTGKNAARKITTMAGMSPMPSHNTMNGSHATGEMGRRNCTTGFRKSHARVHQPMTRPNSTADTQAIR